MTVNFIIAIVALLICGGLSYWIGKQSARRSALENETNLRKDYDSRINAAEQRAALAEGKLSIFENAKEIMGNQFKALASDIFDEKAKRFSEQSKNDLGNLLDPVKNQLNDFRKKVEDFYHSEGKDRSSLKNEIENLLKQNKMLSEDAQNLTKALIGGSKAQGSWGEIILEKVLEETGLRKGKEFAVQQSHESEEGSRQQPDVIIYLPEGRHLVIDSKVSLKAYTAFTASENAAEQEALLKTHINSIQTHIKGLSNKNYQSIYGLNSLDFVLMFVPVEPAFMTAVTNDSGLFMSAWEKNVLLVSPSTLLFVLRTVAHLWRQEAQSQNAQEIAKRGALLYDKFSGFIGDLESVGDKLEKAQDAFDDAKTKLIGNGGLIRQAEMLKELGVKPNKSIPKKLIEQHDSDHSDHTIAPDS